MIDLPTQSSTPALTPTLNPRLMSVDALRGFDMFWIIGADALVYALDRMNDNVMIRGLATQLKHVDWAGFHFYDLIFPLFVFIVGVSLVFSLTKTIEQKGRSEALKRVFRRGILLFAVGIFYSGGVAEPWPNIRLLGVLNRIALCYLFAGLLFCFFKPRALIAICIGLLSGYWALMTFFPIRDIQLDKSNLERLAQATGETNVLKLFYATTKTTTGKFEKGCNVANHFDFQYLPGRRYDVYWDPEGLLSTLPAIATCLLGVFAGLLLANGSIRPEQKVIYLIAGGIIALNFGFLWSLQFPVVKKIWSSSFVLVAGGWSSLLLGAFYLLVDLLKYQKWCQPFVWIGMNSITIYVASNLLGGFRKVATRIAGGDVKNFFDGHVATGMGDLFIALVGLALAFWFVHFLYRRKIFLRL